MAYGTIMGQSSPKPTLEDLGAMADDFSNAEGALDVAHGGTGVSTATANQVFAAPNGSAGAPAFRSLVAADIPNLATSKLTSGTLGVARGGTGKASWTANRLVYPSASTTLTQLAFPTVAGSVLRQGTSGAPYWTSLADLKTELGIDALVGTPFASSTYTNLSMLPGNSTYADGIYYRDVATYTLSFSPSWVEINVNGFNSTIEIYNDGSATAGNWESSALNGAKLYSGGFVDCPDSYTQANPNYYSGIVFALRILLSGNKLTCRVVSTGNYGGSAGTTIRDPIQLSGLAYK